LPLAATALGTVIGGPAGTAIGSTLGKAAAQSLVGPAPAPPRQAPAQPGQAAAASGSTAAAQGLILTQQPDVLKGLLALAMGQHGQKTVNGMPVTSIMNLLSSVFGQAAADADELLYLDGDGLDDAEGDDGEGFGGAYGDSRSLYTSLMDADSYELRAAGEW